MKKPRGKHFLGRAVKVSIKYVCPQCGYQLDGASGVDHNRKPSNGDIAVCIGCAAVLIFETATENLRPIKEEEFYALSDIEAQQITVAVLAVRMVKANRPKPTIN
jgi:hypothetical protein